MRQEFKILILKGILFIALLYLFQLNWSVPNSMDSEFLLKILNVIGISSLVFLWIKKTQYKSYQWISTYFFFGISYLIVHFQFPLLHVMGYEAEGFLKTFMWANGYSANKATLISGMGLLGFYIGNTMLKSNFRSTNSLIPKSKMVYNKKIPWILTSGAYVFYILFFASSGSYRSGHYWAGDEHFLSSYFSYLFAAFITAAILVRLYHLRVYDIRSLTLGRYIKFMSSFPLVFTVQTWQDVEKALLSLKPQEENVFFLSPKDMPIFIGIPSFKALEDQAQEKFPHIKLLFILDCGESPGKVLSAFRHGIKNVVYTGNPKYLQALRSIAAQAHCSIFLERPPASLPSPV